MNDYITLTDCCGLWAGNYCSSDVPTSFTIRCSEKKEKKGLSPGFRAGIKAWYMFAF